MIADIEVYTVMNALNIGVQSIHYILGLFVALTGKNETNMWYMAG